MKFSELVKRWGDGWKGRAIDEYGNEWDFLNNEIAVPEQYITKTEQKLKAFSIINDGWELVPQPVTLTEAANSGKLVKPNVNGRLEYKLLDFWLRYLAENFYGDRLKLLNGEWYIEP